jgi:hypothetical protein
MEDVWVETVHEAERRDGKKNSTDREQKVEDRKKPAGSPKGHRGRERKRAA